MSQHDNDVANSDGATVRADINSALIAQATSNSGAAAPASPQAYQMWADTANDIMQVRNAANNNQLPVFTLSTGSMIQGADIVSAAALPVLSDGQFNDITTGVDTVTSINTLGIGTVKWLQTDVPITFTHHSTNLVLPGGKNIITAAGDVLGFYEYASADWRLISNSADSFPYRVGTDVASATALPLIESGAFDVTGTTTITSINSVGIGSIALLQFDGIVTVTHHSTNLVLPDASNIITVAGQILVFHEYASGDWRLVSNSVPSAGGITLGTEQASTSGTAIDFTGIPAGTKKITVMMVGVSGDGTNNLLIQLGDAGGFETTGYQSGTFQISSSGNDTTGFLVAHQNDAASVYHGNYIFTLEDSANFTWTGMGNTMRSNLANHYAGAGSKSLSAELTQVRVTFTGTPDDFDAGAINIQYE
ncbi:MAG: hypothetical protein HOG49_19410 [Candidatus Scalindua sp.]|jgi:hypothetical protein|nr:hypothetical protein [Candidatus Scalindua sp.]